MEKPIEPDWTYPLPEPVTLDRESGAIQVSKLPFRKGTLKDLLELERIAPPEERAALENDVGRTVNPFGMAMADRLLVDDDAREAFDDIDVADWTQIEAKLKEWAEPSPAVLPRLPEAPAIDRGARVREGTNGAREITLDHPFEVAGDRIEKLTLRRPKLGDIRRETVATPDTQAANLAAKVCGRDVAELGPMLICDWLAVREVVFGFFARSGSSTR